MTHNIFIVNAQYVGANGQFAVVSGFPKVFDSTQYNNDVDKTKKRATGEAGAAWSDMSKIDNRQFQTVTCKTPDGFDVIPPFMDGRIADIPDPEPEQAE
jgi:hypothetical protein